MRNETKLVSAAVLIIMGLASVADAEPVGDNRRPLYVRKLTKGHVIHPDLGLSPYSDYNSDSPPQRVYQWGHGVAFDLQVLDNNGEPYGLGNPIEQFHNYSENSNFQNWTDRSGDHLGPRYEDDDIGSEWTPQNGGIGTDGDSTFTDVNFIVHEDRPRTDDGHYLSVPSTSWFEFDQRWHVTRRSDSVRFRTDTIHHLTASQGDRSRENAGAMPP